MKAGIVLMALGVCTSLAAAGNSVPDTRTETRSERLAYGSKLWVKNRNGFIKVAGWDREEVALTAQIRDSEKRRIELNVQYHGKDLDIEARFQEPVVVFNFGMSPSPRCEMTLNVPRRILAHFRTTNGSVTVSSVEGYARCESTNGDIELRDVKGEAMVETTNGSLDIQNLKARVKGSTTNGRIRIQDVDGGVDLETTNGSISARNLDGWGEGIRLESTNGAIEMTLGRATGDLRAENTHGSIDVRVPGGQVLETGKHSIHVKVPGRDQKIALETTNGSISVR
jgi:DUF4097 and DUF4098 domain-containing protein YvlB